MLFRTHVKNIVTLIIDFTIAYTVFLLGMYVRLGDDLFVSQNFMLVVYNQAVTFAWCGVFASLIVSLHKDVWRFFNIEYFKKYFKYATITSLTFLFVIFFTEKLESFPRSVIVINWVLLVFFTALPRFLYRAYREASFESVFKTSNYKPNPVLIVGLSGSVESFIEEIGRMSQPPYEIVGIIDTKANSGRLLAGVQILGDLKDLKSIIAKLEKKKQRPTRILVGSEASLTGELQKLVKVCKALSLPISRLPKLTQLSHGVGKSVFAFQPIAVEDLLHRSQRQLDFDKIRTLIEHKVVLVTGAGGSIGSEIVKQVIDFGAKAVHLVDNSEFLLYEIEQDCKISGKTVGISANLIDVRDSIAVENIISNTKPDIIFHAAALKHVPLMEKHKIQAAEVNVFGTINVVEAAISHKVSQVVFISTDKAVDPLSFMGSTKRVAEMFCQISKSKDTKISAVRFGNVLGSNGSVVPLFEKQIAAGGPITVTHPDVTRYFMTIPEAVGLVLQTATMNKPEDGCKIYVLDMGQPIKIADLAEQMVVLAGLVPNVDIKIEFSGLRPGEKMHEVLISDHENFSNTESKDVFLTNPAQFDLKLYRKMVTDLKRATERRDEQKCAEIVRKLVGG